MYSDIITLSVNYCPPLCPCFSFNLVKKFFKAIFQDTLSQCSINFEYNCVCWNENLETFHSFHQSFPYWLSWIYLLYSHFLCFSSLMLFPRITVVFGCYCCVITTSSGPDVCDPHVVSDHGVWPIVTYVIVVVLGNKLGWGGVGVGLAVRFTWVCCTDGVVN